MLDDLEASGRGGRFRLISPFRWNRSVQELSSVDCHLGITKRRVGICPASIGRLFQLMGRTQAPASLGPTTRFDERAEEPHRGLRRGRDIGFWLAGPNFVSRVGTKVA